jgi:hypothetical protein
MLTTQIERDACPFCGHQLDAVTAGPENPDATPLPGDLTVCIQCAGLLVFDDQMKVRPPTSEEQAEMLADPQVIRLVEAITGIQIRARRGNDGHDA